MALIIQDATGLVVGANSYATVAYFRAYHDASGTTYEDDDDLIGQALVKALRYMDIRHDYVGRRQNQSGQRTEWPRMWAWNNWPTLQTGIPDEVKDAQCEYALRALSGTTLLPDPDYDATGRQIRSKSEEVGPVKETTEYEKGGYRMPTFPAADEILYSIGLAIRPSSGGLSFGTVGRG